MQAIILAAGMGKRLKELTSESTKCMVKVNGVTMIERMLSILDKKHLERVVIVVGYEGKKLIEYVNSLNVHTPIQYVENSIYDKTNNIYSLYLAKDYLELDDTILLESDLMFEEKVIDKILNNPYPSLALVAKFESWMDGTVVELDPDDNIKCFHSKREFKFEEIQNYYKTVNIYKFSKDFSTTHYVPFLEAYCRALGNNEYYEQVLKVIALLERPDIKAVRLNDDESWYEIDDVQDLQIAESIFAKPEEKLEKFQKCYGGYWRYPHVMDFCYLVNPFFPNQKLIDEMKSNFEKLLCNYPSGMDVNSLLVSKYFGVHRDNIVVGNGAAELIKSLMNLVTGKTGIILPTFEEYPNRFTKEDLVPFIPGNKNFSYTANDLIEFYENKNISNLIIINPDNPSGNFIKVKDILRLAQWCEQKHIRLIIDESFVDFAESDEEETLLVQGILENNLNLIVVKSISKSFGVPGLRLGIIASGDMNVITSIKKDVAIWNINSFSEYYLQIFEKYKSEYSSALQKFKSVRKDYIQELEKIKFLRVLPSQANYVMCEVLPPYNAKEITQSLLCNYNIFIKDLSGKKGIGGKQYIRIAVKNNIENLKLISALNRMTDDTME